jgi:hypothetical protein
VVSVLAGPADGLAWCDRLENAAAGAVVGKVLCVCAAAAVARTALAVSALAPEEAARAADAVGLVVSWVDDPTNERFERICALIFGEGRQAADLGPHGVVWRALRTATSSVGNDEAGWALRATCGAAVSAGLGPEQLREVVERELLSRQRPVGPAQADASFID